MTQLVVDASVALKWYVDEPWSTEARQLLSNEARLVVPQLFFIEIANILRKRFERKEVTANEVWTTFDSLERLPLQVWTNRPLSRRALEIALDLRLSVCDAIYVVLAARLDGQLVTADRRLTNALAAADLRSRVVWIEDIALSENRGS